METMVILYGIRNCDTVKKARSWLDRHGRDYRFHDFRVDGLDRALFDRFDAALGWNQLLNKRSTTWRNLAEDQRRDLSLPKVRQLLLAQPALIKRPVLERDGKFLLGFSDALYTAELI